MYPQMRLNHDLPNQVGQMLVWIMTWYAMEPNWRVRMEVCYYYRVEG